MSILHNRASLGETQSYMHCCVPDEENPSFIPDFRCQRRRRSHDVYDDDDDDDNETCDATLHRLTSQ